MLRRDHQWLLALETQLKARGLEVSAALRRSENEVVPEILREAERLCPHLMGSHGHTALHHLLLGSVSAGVLHRAACPVLIVPTRRVGVHEPAGQIGAPNQGSTHQ